MARVLKGGSSCGVFDLKLPRTLGFIPFRIHDTMVQLDISVEIILSGYTAEVLQDLRGAGVAR